MSQQLSIIRSYLSSLCTHDEAFMYHLTIEGEHRYVCSKCGQFWEADTAQDAVHEHKLMLNARQDAEKALVELENMEAAQVRSMAPWDGVLRPDDLVISTYETGGSWGMQRPRGVKIVHIPTRIEVQCDTHRSEHRNKVEAVQHLSDVLANYCALNSLHYVSNL